MTVNWQRRLSALLVKTSSPYTLLRTDAGVYDENGIYNQPEATQSTIQGHIQPLNGIEKEELPEGRRNSDTLKIYTDDKLRGVNSENRTQPDKLVYPEQWQAEKTYVAGEQVTNDTGPIKIYICTTSGTSAASGGPTGDGTSISDGTCVWDYVSKRKLYEIFSSKVRNVHYKSLAIRVER